MTRHRLQGFQDAWAELGGAWADLRVAVCPVNDTQDGEALAAELLIRDGAPDAIAAMSDELALGALRAATQAGLAVPAALAVTGWDDTDAAAPAGLTTVAQSLRDQGACCARVALGQLSTGQDRAPWKVTRRQSTRTRATSPTP